MLRQIVVSALLLLPFTAPVARAQDALPLPVFVTMKKLPLPPQRTAEEHGFAITKAQNEMFELAARMRKEHGDKMQAWPPEAIAAVEYAEDQWNRATVEGYYEWPNTQLGLDDSVQDFIRGAGKSKALTVAPSAEGAAFVVTITNRRYLPSKDITGNSYFIRFRLQPGGKTTGEQFVELVRGYKWNTAWSQVLSRPNNASGFVELEAGSMASYKNCAAAVRSVVERFIWQRLGPEKDKKKK
jgi:hypothetical protein